MEMNAEIKNQIVLAPPRRLGPLAKPEKTALETAADTREADIEAVERSRQKWGTAADAGFQIIPDVLFRCQRFGAGCDRCRDLVKHYASLVVRKGSTSPASFCHRSANAGE